MKNRIALISTAIIALFAILFLMRLVASTRQEAIGGFTTPLAGRSHAQICNIRKAASAIDGKLIMPDNEFSFNSSVGKCSAARGYASAPLIIKGKLEKEEGGGVCQVSSTLYNAALLAGMEITERNPHSQPVSSVSPGRDAAVLFGASDLRFVNCLSEPVTIRASVDENRLKIRILSRIRPVEKYNLVSEVKNSEEIRRHNKITDKIQTCTAVLWRERIVAGKVVSKELISSDTYTTLQ